MKQQNSWHFARPELANKYLDLFEMGLTSARGLFARHPDFQISRTTNLHSLKKPRNNGIFAI